MHKCIGADQTNWLKWWLKWLKMTTKTKWWVNILFEHSNISFVFLLCDHSMFCILPTLYICFWTFWRNSRLEFLNPPNIFKFTMSTLRVRSPPGHNLPLVFPVFEDTTIISQSPNHKTLMMLYCTLYISTPCSQLSFTVLLPSHPFSCVLSSPPNPPSPFYTSSPLPFVTLAVTLALGFSDNDTCRIM